MLTCFYYQKILYYKYFLFSDPSTYMAQDKNTTTESRDLNKVVLYVLDQFPKM